MFNQVCQRLNVAPHLLKKVPLPEVEKAYLSVTGQSTVDQTKLAIRIRQYCDEQVAPS